MKKINQNLNHRIIYFCGGKKCCPSLEFTDEPDDTCVHIKDDFDNMIEISKEQLGELKKKLNEMEDI